MAKRPTVFAAWLACALLTSATRVSAFSTGITTQAFGSSGCNSCHSGGSTPTASISGPTYALPGSIHTYSLDVATSGSQLYAGLNVSALDGTLGIGGPTAKLTQILSGTGGRAEITHSAPKAAKDSLVPFSFVWTAPPSFTSIDLDGWANAVNLSHSTSGDAAVMTTHTVNNGTYLCPPSPSSCTAPGKSSLKMGDLPGKQSLSFKWNKGTVFTPSDFGSPDSTTNYALCLYADSVLQVEMYVDSGATPWVPTSNGFKLKTKRPSSLQSVVLAAGEGPATSKIQAKGKGAGIALPATLPFGAATTVSVQLINSANSNCWGDDYDSAEITKNTSVAFSAKAEN